METSSGEKIEWRKVLWSFKKRAGLILPRRGNGKDHSRKSQKCENQGPKRSWRPQRRRPSGFKRKKEGGPQGMREVAVIVGQKTKRKNEGGKQLTKKKGTGRGSSSNPPPKQNTPPIQTKGIKMRVKVASTKVHDGNIKETSAQT